MNKVILANKNVLVTGAAHGIGAAIALQLAREGCDLLLVDCDEKKLNERAKEVKALGSDPLKLVVDLGKASEREKLFRYATDKSFPVHILVNNVSVGYWASFMNTPQEKLEEIINVNIKCITHLTKLFLPDMVEKNEGSIINLSSTASFIGGPNIACYSATKAYIRSFSESLSMELSNTGVNVLAVCAGATESRFWEYAKMKGTSYERNMQKLPAESVAKETVDAIKSRKTEIVTGLRNKLNMFIVKLAPRTWIKRIAFSRFNS